MERETVLVVGATGNIGVSAVTAALRSGRNVLAIVRNQDSANKLIKHIGSSKGITFAEADVTSDTGVKGVVDRVQAGELPSFQHVWTSVGGFYTDIPIKDITTDLLRQQLNIGFEANFFAYRDTMPYLLTQSHPSSTFTICTGAQGNIGLFPLPAMTQGPLFSFAMAAARETEGTNVRFNELYLAFRVEVDEEAEGHEGVMKASQFAGVYEKVLEDQGVKGGKVLVEGEGDVEKLRWERKF